VDEWKHQKELAAEQERQRLLAQEEARKEAERLRAEALERQKEEQAKRDAEEAARLAAEATLKAREKAVADSLAAVQLVLQREMEKRKLAADQKKSEEDKLKELAQAEQNRKRAEAEKLARQKFIADSISKLFVWLPKKRPEKLLKTRLCEKQERSVRNLLQIQLQQHV
jgi:hypothetical protein